MSDKEEQQEAAAREELGQRLSTATPYGATGSAAIAHQQKVSAESEPTEPAAEWNPDLEQGESTAHAAGKQTSADKPAAKAKKAAAPTGAQND